MRKTLIIIENGDMRNYLKNVIEEKFRPGEDVDIVFLSEKIKIEGVVDDFKSYEEEAPPISINIVSTLEKIEDPKEKYYALFLIGRDIEEEVKRNEKLTSVAEYFHLLK